MVQSEVHMFNRIMGILFLIVGIIGMIISLFNGNIIGGIVGGIVFIAIGLVYIRLANKRAKRKAALEAAGIKEQKDKELPEDYVDPRFKQMGLFKF